MDILAVHLLVRILFSERLSREISPRNNTSSPSGLEHSQLFQKSRPVGPLVVLQSDADAETNTHDCQDNRDGIIIFLVMKGVGIQLKAEWSVSVTNNCATGLIYMEPHSSSMRNQRVLQSSGIVNELLHMPILIGITNFSKKPTKYPGETLLGVGTYPRSHW